MKKFIYGSLAFTPVFAFAALQGIQTLVDDFGNILEKVIPIMFALAIIYFFWGIIKYIRSAGDPKGAQEGKSIMIYGIIAIAVMISVYGLVAWLRSSLGVGTETNLPLPTVPGIQLLTKGFMSNVTIVPFLNRVNEFILNPLIWLVFALSSVYFIYGIINFLRLESADKSREEARNAIMWGIIGMVIMFSVYGIIHFILATFGISNNDLGPTAPQYLQ